MRIRSCIPSLVLTFFLLFSSTTESFTLKHGVTIRSALPGNSGPFRAHCKSKDDDLGTRIITPGSPGFTWKFVPKVWGNTLYYCYFFWNGKQASFDVYNHEISPTCENPDTNYTRCYWLAMVDGFYFTNIDKKFPDGWKKKHDWSH